MNSTNPTPEAIEAERKAFGARLAAVRHLKGWKQEFVAEKLGLTKAALSAWETGRNLPDAMALKRLSKLYGIGVDAILSEATKPTSARAAIAAASG
jgi:transcriptional regulator with XRE-family HTH domain